MSAQPDAEQRQGALASRTRRQVLAALGDASEPLDAAAIAKRFNIHVTTARFHLEQLESAGFIERHVQRAGQRGRPRVVFTTSAAVHTEDALRQLNSVLVDALAHDVDGGRSRARVAGERWSREYDDMPNVGADDSGPLVRIFDRLGFKPEMRDDPLPDDLTSADAAPDTSATDVPVSADRDRILELHGCPFRDAAVEHPEVVCSAHRGLLEGTIQRLGHEVGEATLYPFVEPELCVVRLRGALASR